MTTRKILRGTRKPLCHQIPFFQLIVYFFRQDPADNGAENRVHRLAENRNGPGHFQNSDESPGDADVGREGADCLGDQVMAVFFHGQTNGGKSIGQRADHVGHEKNNGQRRIPRGHGHNGFHQTGDDPRGLAVHQKDQPRKEDEAAAVQQQKAVGSTPWSASAATISWAG